MTTDARRAYLKRYGKPCGAYKECAYYAWNAYDHLEEGAWSRNYSRPIWLCDNCSRLYKLDGWVKVKSSLPGVTFPPMEARSG